MAADAASEHLEYIDTVHRVLGGVGIPHWLAGGWAVDFTLGRITRSHRDIEFAVWATDWIRVEVLLAAQGLREEPPEFADEVRELVAGSVEFEFWMLTHDEQGRVVVGGRWSDWPFPDGSLDAGESRLEGVSCPVLSAEFLLDSKVRFPEHPYGRPLREKDRDDIELLRAHIAGRAASQ